MCDLQTVAQVTVDKGIYMTIKTEKELGKALKDDLDTIIIEGDLVKKVIRIKATGKIAWAIAIGAIGVSVAAVLATPVTGGASNAVHFVTAPAAVTVLGGAAVTAAIAIAVAGGSVTVLNKLRKYKIEEQSKDCLILKRK